MAPKHQPSSSPATTAVDAFFASPGAVYLAAALLRATLLLYGLWQDAHSPLKYTDIDYVVFTDAARFVAAGGSPYARETYRYTPLLAWLLLPTARASTVTMPPALAAAWFASGKVLFALADLVAGWLLVRILTMPGAGTGTGTGGRGTGMSPARARKFAAVWLLNPMVAAISTRGSAEGLLGALVAALLWAVLSRRAGLAGLLLGFGVHFKIYPFIYAPAIVWWMDDERWAGNGEMVEEKKNEKNMVLAFFTPARVKLAVVSLGTFLALNVLMFSIYGFPFLQHTYLHHVTRIDHRHNFSLYNTQLYLASAQAAHSSSSQSTATSGTGIGIESVAFAPQLLLSTALIPLALAKRDLASAMLAQTFAFVTFNKVCTSQYFLWYMILLPLYLPRSSFLGKMRGILAAALWAGTQAAWLQQGFTLEFLGKSAFVPGLWLASLAFFAVNCWILGVIVGDVAGV